jgi:hypothetical protein
MSDRPAWFPSRTRFSVDLDDDIRRERDEMFAASVGPSAEELERWADEDGRRVLVAVSCPDCGARRGERCFPGSSAPHYQRAALFARLA